MITTMIERITQSHTSESRSVRIEVEPNSVEHTSPVRFEDVE